MLQVKDYLQGEAVQQRMEEELTRCKLELCQARQENEKFLDKLEKMQDKVKALRKQATCVKCTKPLPNSRSKDNRTASATTKNNSNSNRQRAMQRARGRARAKQSAEGNDRAAGKENLRQRGARDVR